MYRLTKLTFAQTSLFNFHKAAWGGGGWEGGGGEGNGVIITHINVVNILIFLVINKHT